MTPKIGWLGAIASFDALAEPCVLVTLVEHPEPGSRRGAKLVVGVDRIVGGLDDAALEHEARRVARAMLVGAQAQARTLRICDATLAFEPIRPATLPLALLGAGAVAQALMPILTALPCAVRWIATGEQRLPEGADGLQAPSAEDALAQVAAMPAGSYFMVMTHDHALDLRLADAILRRDDVAYFGMIGSHAKRARFSDRLREAGIGDAQLARMSCPIGLPAVGGKLPVEIAVAIAGEVIAHYRAARQESADA